MHSDSGTHCAPAAYQCHRFVEETPLLSGNAAVFATFRGKACTFVFSPFTVDPVLAGGGMCMLASSRFGWHVCGPDGVLRFYSTGSETLSDPIPLAVAGLVATPHATKVTCTDGAVVWLDRGKPVPPPRALQPLVNPMHVCCPKIAVTASAPAPNLPATLKFTIYE
jgi:hypothetical protein